MALRIAILLALAWCLATPAWAATYLEVARLESGELTARLPLEQGSTFYLEFINSIYLAPVRETFMYKPPDGICLIKVESPSAGVFEYYRLISDGQGTALLYRPVGEFILHSHDYEHHTLAVGERSIRLKGLVPDGEPVVVRVRTHGD
ncbi:MAG TPA: hypothetical protein VMT71_12170 [Syntrophorhabdales bacterium]|nr:hypothetical protein [Syntrophorhabdales bacterium]